MKPKTTIIILLNFLFTALGFSQTINTIAGNGTAGFGGDGGPATSAACNFTSAVARDIYGNLYITDRYNHRIRKVDQNGIISTIAGTGTAGFSGDGGPATSANLNNPIGIVVTQSGIIYFTDNSNQRVRKIDVNGIITTICGTGTAGFLGDNGLATLARVNFPWGLALDANEDLYIADRNNDRVRKITISSGIITTIAGNGTNGYSGNGGPATSAAMNRPIAICFDLSGNLYIADEDNHRVRKVNTSGVISLFAGNGTGAFGGDGGAATSASLNYPSGVHCDNAGNVYIGDRFNHRIRKVNTLGVISTIAGTGTAGFSGDGGNATSARLNYPREIISDGSGNIYIADASNNRVRKITYCLLPTIPTLSATNNNFCSGGNTTISITSGLLNAATNWEWYTASCGGIHVGSGVSLNVSPITTTTYYVRGEGGCVTPYGCASITITVLQVPPQPAAISGNISICENSTNIYSIAPVTGATSYSWALPQGWTGTSTTTTISVTADNNSGTISVYALNGCGASLAQTLMVNVNALPTISISANNNTICAGDTVSLLANGASNYLWLPGNFTTQIINVSPTTTTTYTLIGTDGNGCSNTDIRSITVNPLPSVTYSENQNLLCINWSPITLTPGIPTNGTYSGPGVTGNIFDPVLAGQGTHTITYTYVDVNGCSNTDSSSITVDLCTGLNPIFSNNLITIYPNPTNGNFVIDISVNETANAVIKIANTLGEIVMIKNTSLVSGQNKMNFDLSQMAKGIYFVQVNTSNGLVTKKLTVK